MYVYKKINITIGFCEKLLLFFLKLVTIATNKWKMATYIHIYMFFCLSYPQTDHTKSEPSC